MSLNLAQYPPKPLILPEDYYREMWPAGRNGPSVTVVTPSYNQAEFLERTLRSVLDQKYSGLEYIVQDGASTDDSESVILRYQKRLSSFESISDSGQANAVNRGFARSTGGIMAWLNSDDLLLPGSLAYVADFFEQNPDVDVVYGHRILIDELDREIGRWILPRHRDASLSWADYIPQETMFWRREIWERTGGRLDESFRYALDWDLILRFRAAGARFARLPRFLGAFRIHTRQKTTAWLDVGQEEMYRLRQRVLGRPVGELEVALRIRPYWWRSAAYKALYRMGLLRY